MHGPKSSHIANPLCFNYLPSVWGLGLGMGPGPFGFVRGLGLSFLWGVWLRILGSGLGVKGLVGNCRV